MSVYDQQAIELCSNPSHCANDARVNRGRCGTSRNCARLRRRFRGQVRCGMASIETLLVLASFVIATIVFMQLGWQIMSMYFVHGSQLTALPFL